MLRLEPMDEATYVAWREATKREYATEKVKAGNWAETDADALAEEAFATLLPNGRETPGHEVRAMVNEGYARLGLAEIEAYARERACLGVMLHVFGNNDAARQLYSSAGYLETNVVMLKLVER